MPEGLPLIRPGNVSRLGPIARPWEKIGLPFTDLAFSPDGKLIAGTACDQTVQLWEIETGDSLPVPVTENTASCLGAWKLAFSPAGYLFASSANPTTSQESPHITQLWTVSINFGLQPLQDLPAGPRPVTSLAFSPDGRILAAGTQDNRVRLWFISDPGDPLATPITELADLVLPDWALDVDFSPDGRWLAVGTSTRRDDLFEPAVLVWSVQDLLEAGTGEVTVFETLDAKSGPLHQVSFSPDGRLLAAAGGGLTLWEIPDKSQGEGLEEGEKPAWDERLFQEIPLPAIDFSPDGLLLAAGGQELQILVVGDALANRNDAAGQWIFLEQTGEEIRVLDFSPGGNLLTTLSVDGTATLWGIQR